MFKKNVLLLALATLIGCAVMMNSSAGVVVIQAQTLPITKTFEWDANDVAEGVTGYVVTFDAAVVGTTTGTSIPFTIPTAGKHRLTVAAQNIWGTGSVATLDINVVVPGGPKNPRIK